MNDDFEQHLRRQSMREIPPQWRAEIFTAARPAPHASIWREWLATCNLQPATTLRWGALAAAWVVIFALRHASQDTSPIVEAKYTPPTPQVMQALRAERKLLAELADPAAAPPQPEPAVPVRPGPRSERRTDTDTV